MCFTTKAWLMMNMMKIISNKIDKKVVVTLPCVLFEGRVVVVQSVAECDKAVDYLLRQELLGFDTETRPSFRKGKSYKVSLVQISTHDVCFLFRLNMIGFPPSLKRLLESVHVTIVGLSLKDDFASLRRREEFEPGDFVELQDFVKKFGIEDMSLQKIYANLFGQKISKSQRLSNWEADVLSDKQKYYAATDAWACIKIYEELQQMQSTGNYRLEKVVEEIDNNIEHV